MIFPTRQHLAILASGAGSNAMRCIGYFRGHPRIRVALVASNNASAPVLDLARKEGVPTEILPGRAWDDKERIREVFTRHGIDAVVLAGYLRLLPGYFIKWYPGRILNVHPALLPRFGGRGMYGMHVHRAVIASGEKQTGITIHLVTEAYDEGPILFQDSVPVLPDDTPASLAERVKMLEHRHYPRVVEAYLLNG